MVRPNAEQGDVLDLVMIIIIVLRAEAKHDCWDLFACLLGKRSSTDYLVCMIFLILPTTLGVKYIHRGSRKASKKWNFISLLCTGRPGLVWRPKLLPSLGSTIFVAVVFSVQDGCWSSRHHTISPNRRMKEGAWFLCSKETFRRSHTTTALFSLARQHPPSFKGGLVAFWLNGNEPHLQNQVFLNLKEKANMEGWVGN